ncbi:SDR family oxidoreductase [Labrys sp. WJW]|uniref:SDR family oxidoreductase n=1 Tax=Labrys sp. WJW TaxID=1737983 RepID=UPI000836258B|nr:SDR family oxidoreductase [Labrys sp. WJW]OCC03851.1 SDR family oxidoreductase [Labrys sp. WJW]
MSEPSLSDPFGLAGRHVLLTGAGGGIGRAMIEAFLRAGATVSGADRDGSLLESLPLQHRLVFDLTDARACSEAIAGLVAEGSVPDILVNNAGFTRAETLGDVDEAVWDSELAINLTGAFHVTRPVMAAMAVRGSGSVVFVASVNGLGHYGNPAYSAAKAGLIAYAKSIAVEAGRDGIRANVVCPGSVRTPAWDHRLAKDPAILEDVVSHYPLGRMVRPEDVANTAVFLASPLAAGVTGAVLPVDGGLTAGNLRFVRDIIERKR